LPVTGRAVRRDDFDDQIGRTVEVVHRWLESV
jgi:hypothetical protein